MPKTVLGVWGLSVNKTGKISALLMINKQKGSDSECSKVIHLWSRVGGSGKSGYIILSRLLTAGFTGRLFCCCFLFLLCFLRKKRLNKVTEWAMWIFRGKHSKQRDQQVEGPWGKGAPGLFQEQQRGQGGWSRGSEEEEGDRTWHLKGGAHPDWVGPCKPQEDFDFASKWDRDKRCFWAGLRVSPDADALLSGSWILEAERWFRGSCNNPDEGWWVVVVV